MSKYRKLQYSGSKKTCNEIGKWAKILNILFTKEEKQITNKYENVQSKEN